MTEPFKFFEFFAGGGMARAGLGQNWECLFANDFDPMKGATYCQNWGEDHFVLGDVAKLRTSDLPGEPDMVWASFPCQDLSLAGSYRGLGDAENVTRSGTFWPFWALMTALMDEDRRPKLIVLENVVGALTSRKGEDFKSICDALANGGYTVGAFVADARHFVPQSRPRLFFVAVDRSVQIPSHLKSIGGLEHWHPPALCAAQSQLSGEASDNWTWWQFPRPPLRNSSLADVIESVPSGCEWHSRRQTDHLLEMMAPLHRAKIAQAKAAGKKLVGAIYKRTRFDHLGKKQQRAEVRFDGIAGCLRTPGGGSSRQTIICIDGSDIQTRLLSPREAARLMGLVDTYRLPTRYNDAYKVAGDGVCVPVVNFIATHLLEPLLRNDGSVASKMAA